MSGLIFHLMMCFPLVFSGSGFICFSELVYRKAYQGANADYDGVGKVPHIASVEGIEIRPGFYENYHDEVYRAIDEGGNAAEEGLAFLGFIAFGLDEDI